MSHHHSNKKEPSKDMNPQSKSAETAQKQGAQSPAAPLSEKEQAGETKKSSSETVELLRTELDRCKDQSLALQAELENYRKRAAREMDEHRRYANIGLIRELLPVLDNIQRAIEAAEKSTDGSGLLDGVKLVAQQLQGVLGAPSLREDRGIGHNFRSAPAPCDFAATFRGTSGQYNYHGYARRVQAVRPSGAAQPGDRIDKRYM